MSQARASDSLVAADDAGSFQVFGNIRYVDKSGNNAIATGSQSLPFLTIKAAQDSFTDLTVQNHIIVGPGQFLEDADFVYKNNMHIIGSGRNETQIGKVTGAMTWSPLPLLAGGNASSLTLRDFFQLNGLTITRTDDVSILGISTAITAINVPGNTITVGAGLALPANGIPTSAPSSMMISKETFTVFDYTNYNSGTGVISGITFPQGGSMSAFVVANTVNVNPPAATLNASFVRISNLTYNGVGTYGDLTLQDQINVDNSVFLTVTLLGAGGNMIDSRTNNVVANSLGTAQSNIDAFFVMRDVAHLSVTSRNFMTVEAYGSPFRSGSLTLDSVNSAYWTDAVSAGFSSIVLQNSALATQVSYLSKAAAIQYTPTVPGDWFTSPTSAHAALNESGSRHAAAQADSTAVLLADLVTDFNALLAKLRAVKLLDT